MKNVKLPHDKLLVLGAEILPRPGTFQAQRPDRFPPLKRDWDATIEDAAKRAAGRLVVETNRDELLILQVVRVVRRKPLRSPVEVLGVKP